MKLLKGWLKDWRLRATPVNELEQAVSGWKHHVAGAVDRLFTVVGPAGDDGLSAIASEPRLILDMDRAARRFYTGPQPVRDAGERVALWATSPVLLVLASMHPDGRVRERAVQMMVQAPSRAALPFLAVRANDWVPQVRERARAGLARLLYEAPFETLTAIGPVVILLGRRSRGDFMVAQAEATMLRLTATQLTSLIHHRDAGVRRLAFTVACYRKALPPKDLAGLALTHPDIRIRTLAAEAIAIDSAWRQQPSTLARLTAAATPQVRANALTGLARCGDISWIHRHLADPAPMVRALARDTARRNGIDARGWYREQAAQDSATPFVLLGLGECGSAADWALVEPYLSDRRPSVRAAAVAALRNLKAIDPAKLVALLDDSSSKVIGQVDAALRPFAVSVDQARLWALLNGGDSRASRRLAYRQLRESSDGATQLRAALIMCQDSDYRLAGRAIADVRRWVTESKSAVELTDMEAAIEAAASALDEPTAAALRAMAKSVRIGD